MINVIKKKDENGQSVRASEKVPEKTGGQHLEEPFRASSAAFSYWIAYFFFFLSVCEKAVIHT